MPAKPTETGNMLQIPFRDWCPAACIVTLKCSSLSDYAVRLKNKNEHKQLQEGHGK